jgi:hypothetical protein
MTAFPVGCSLRDQFGECVEVCLERANQSELDVLLGSHLNQEGLNARETLRDGQHDGGDEGRNVSTTCVMSRHPRYGSR